MTASQTPRPGIAVRGSTSGQPLMAAFDLLGRRWAIVVLWTLREGPLGFRDIRRELSTISPTVLSTRLREFQEAGLLATDDNGHYELTPLGVSLLKALAPLKLWSRQWAEALTESATPSQ